MIEYMLMIWNIGLSILLFWVIRCQENQEELLYALRDDLNKAKICDECIVNTLKKGKVILPTDQKIKKSPTTKNDSGANWGEKMTLK